jgi:coenzyme F420-reducing hydrogenase beta subunit
MTRAIIESALSINELAHTLDNISYSDKKEIKDYTDAEILHEAKYVLGLFTDPNESHWNAEDFRGENGLEQQKWAKTEVRKLKALIKKYS